MLDFFRKKKKTGSEDSDTRLQQIPAEQSQPDQPVVSEFSELAQDPTDHDNLGSQTILAEPPPAEGTAGRSNLPAATDSAQNVDLQTEESQPSQQQVESCSTKLQAAEPIETPKTSWFGRMKRKFSSAPEPSEAAPAQELDEPSAALADPEAAELWPATDAPPNAEIPLPAEALAVFQTPHTTDSPDSADSPDPIGPAADILEKSARATAQIDADQPGAASERPEAISDQTALQEKTDETPAEGDAPAEEKIGWFGRMKQKLASTREMLAGRLEKVLSKVREIDEDILEELEEVMITSDLGVKTTNDILFKIRGQVAKKELKDSAALKLAIKSRILEMIDLKPQPPTTDHPHVILMVGVNGVGKTTTIAKLTQLYKNQGQKVLLAAGDTFRAAAVEQLTIWAKRLGTDIVSQPTGADPSAVVYDSLTAAKARGADVVIIDTAGRLHTRVNLMDELKKIKRVAHKVMPGAPHETILILDANTGQNAARQAEMFHKAVEVDSLIVTKLDGTSKAGVIVSIINELKLPVTFIGLGETFEDLRPFDPQAFVEAILGSQ
ncbi:MAG: signal recognition particle-docking protein FtsY [Deltaproteobacteria bacterium]|jgi:fused signal recognition particle receptor|nr:signal recognition particle-docking protein FtsY [Deltaproteobacteria bacterium]